MNLKKISKLITFALTLGFLYTNINNNIYALEPSDKIDMKISPEDDLSIGEIKDIFQKYLDKNNINIKFGTPEYLDYIYSQMLENKDKNLSSHPKYDLIRSYFAEYIIAVQNYQSNIKNSRFKNFTSNFTLDQLINENKTISEIREEEIEKEERIEKSKILTPRYLKNARYTGYNHRNAINYAKKWANSFNNIFERYQADCTNFVSQCLNAGGIREKKPSGGIPALLNTTRYWYGHRPYVSTSWIRVEDFYTYWSTKVPTSNYKTRKSVINNSNIGDIVQFKDPKTFRRWHSMIVTGKDNKSVYLTGHSRPRVNYSILNYNEKDNYWSVLDF